MSRRVTSFAVFLILLTAAFAQNSHSAAQSREDSRAYYQKGLALMRENQNDEAKDFFAEAAKADPDFPHPWLALGRLYLDDFRSTMHNYSEAVDAFDHLNSILIKKPPELQAKDLLLGYYYQGILLLKGGEYEKAIESLEKFTDLYPEYYEIHKVYNSIGIAYYYMDQYDRAVVCFKRAIEIDKTFAEARFNLRSVFTRVSAYSEASYLNRTGEYDRALMRLTQLKDIAPRYLAGRRLEASLLIKLKRPEEAVVVYNEILGFEPNNPETYWMRIDMARALLGLNKKEEAGRVLMENLARFPEQRDQRAYMEVVKMLSSIGGR